MCGKDRGARCRNRDTELVDEPMRRGDTRSEDYGELTNYWMDRESVSQQGGEQGGRVIGRWSEGPNCRCLRRHRCCLLRSTSNSYRASSVQRPTGEPSRFRSAGAQSGKRGGK